MIIKFINKIIFLIKFLLNPQFFFKESRSQNENQENLFLNYLSDFIIKKTFIEIGFHHLEFNCISLIKKNFKGLMIDGGRPINIYILKFIIFMLRKDITILKRYLTIENVLESIKFEDIGCLSLDIDGNDYWILKKIIESNIFPEVIIVEYNASFLDKSISIPYDELFDRKKKHKSGFYHGASLSAFYKILNSKNYNLVKIIGGANAIFVNDDLLKKTKLVKHTPDKIYEECLLRNKWSNLTAKEQFEIIRHLEVKIV